MSVAAFERMWRCVGAQVLEELWGYGEDERLEKALRDATQAVRDVNLTDLLRETPSQSTEAVMLAVCQLLLPRRLMYSQTLNWREMIQQVDFKENLLGLNDQVKEFVNAQNQAEKNNKSIGSITNGLIKLAQLRKVASRCKEMLGEPAALSSTVESRFVHECDCALRPRHVTYIGHDSQAMLSLLIL